MTYPKQTGKHHFLFEKRLFLPVFLPDSVPAARSPSPSPSRLKRHLRKCIVRCRFFVGVCRLWCRFLKEIDDNLQIPCRYNEFLVGFRCVLSRLLSDMLVFIRNRQKGRNPQRIAGKLTLKNRQNRPGTDKI